MARTVHGEVLTALMAGLAPACQPLRRLLPRRLIHGRRAEENDLGAGQLSAELRQDGDQVVPVAGEWHVSWLALCHRVVGADHQRNADDVPLAYRRQQLGQVGEQHR